VVYSLVAVVLLVAIAIGAKASHNNVELVANTQTSNDTPTVNQVVEANIVASLAETADMPVASNAANISQSLAIKQQMAKGDDATIVKPQLIDTASLPHGIASHTVVEGETLATIAEANGITLQTLQWANGLTGTDVKVGSTLVVPSVDGVVYTAQAGDTAEKLAEKYGSDAARIIALNDLELTGIKPGDKLIIPDGNLPETERPGYTAPASMTNIVSVQSAASPMYNVSAGNKYAYGYCTWYAYERRVQLGRPVGSYWGNASSWYYSAMAAGYGVGREPAVGAIMQTGGGYGHVAIVESINWAAGTMTYSDMNGVAGWNRVGYKTISLATARNYNYIY